MFNQYQEQSQQAMLAEIRASKTEMAWVRIIKTNGEELSIDIDSLEGTLDDVSAIHSMSEMTEWHRLYDGWLKIDLFARRLVKQEKPNIRKGFLEILASWFVIREGV